MGQQTKSCVPCVLVNKFYWNPAIHLGVTYMAAFVRQWQGWVVARETIWPANLRYLLYDPFRKQKSANTCTDQSKEIPNHSQEASGLF